MKGGKTGVMGILKTGKPGPVVALRFEMDANDLNESREESHRPFKEGFSSVNEPATHACGHDGHVAIGVGIAKLLMQCRDQLAGTIKLIFQPCVALPLWLRKVLWMTSTTCSAYIWGSPPTKTGS